MPAEQQSSGTPASSISIDEIDRVILRVMQADASLSLDRIADKAGLSKTAVWNRIQRLQQAKVIERQTVVIDPAKVGLIETFFIQIRTSAHESGWLEKFNAVVRDMPEITEAHRLAGEIDYILKVQVPSTRHFDAFYKRLVGQISVFNVTSSLSMETM
ncbi:MAG: Lrp/AsnC family transcriptional regulator, partial [Proteobacteria bacterium]|nr:Lrp/AsnC family transcriptional regulator [Pseudomonadota bacterium]